MTAAAEIAELITSHDGTDVGAVVRRKSTYGRRDWAVWRGKDDHFYAAPLCRTSIKAALLARGTKGRWSVYGRGGVSSMQTWSVGILMHRNWRHIAAA